MESIVAGGHGARRLMVKNVDAASPLSILNCCILVKPGQQAYWSSRSSSLYGSFPRPSATNSCCGESSPVRRSARPHLVGSQKKLRTIFLRNPTSYKRIALWSYRCQPTTTVPNRRCGCLQHCGPQTEISLEGRRTAPVALLMASLFPSLPLANLM